MTTAEDYASLSNAAYLVDPLRQMPPRTVDDTFYTVDDPTKQQWQVLEIPDNVNTGFQAMAVAPITNGALDESQIYISFAGTNFDDLHDVGAAIGVVIATRSAQAE